MVILGLEGLHNKMNNFFTDDELRCKCCGKINMKSDFLEQLNSARAIANVPFIISSGYRCEKHNTEVGSTSKNHVSGRAVDILCQADNMRIIILRALIKADFVRIGIGRNYIHVDNMNREKKKSAIWLYT